MQKQTEHSKLYAQHIYKSKNKADMKKNLNHCMEKVIMRFLNKSNS